MEFMESPSPEAREDHSLSCSIARGGPMFVPNLVGPLTSVPNFESSLLQLLQDLETEISSGLVNPCDDDISVDELKVFSEEELVNMAMKEAFKDGEAADFSSQLPENQSITGGEYGQGISNGELSLGENSASKEDASTAPQCTNGFTSKATSDTALGDNARRGRKKTKNSRADGRAVGSYLRLPKNQSNSGEGLRQGISNSELFRLENSARNKDASTALECSSECTSKSTSNTTTGDGAKKRKRKTNNKQSLAVSYIAKVEEVVKIKQKQDEEKATAAGLHSYNANKEGAVASVERAERLEIMRSTGSKVKLKPSIIQGHVPMQYPEVLLSVEVHHNSRKSNKVQEFLVLGRQMLTELRDKIYCITDHIMEKAGLYDPSGYFLIEDVFCNDLRDPSAIDYSKPILQWLVSSKEEALRKWECIVSGELQQKQKAVVGEVTNLQLPQFKAVEMQKARLCDLKFQLGAGYLYCHQGDCRHSIVIRDMRLIHPDDVQNRAAYPITTFQLKTRALKCCVCKIYRATKVTLDDKWAPENPCYFCDNCYFLLHYSRDRSLLYSDFSVFDYHPD